MKEVNFSFDRSIQWGLILGPWLVVSIFWAMDLTYYSDRTTLSVLVAIAVYAVPLSAGSLLLDLWSETVRLKNTSSKLQTIYLADVHILERVARRLFYGFLGILCFEIAYFGYIPLPAMLMGAEITHFDFGIPGLHGFLFALGTAAATASYLAQQITKRKEFTFFTAIIILAFILLVTRKMIILIFVQIFVLEILLNKWRRIKYFSAIGFLVVYLFGWLGDIRTGREAILSLANLRGDYPDWLPSGFIWIYLYILTPAANYMNFIEIMTPSHSLLDLLAWLIPAGLSGRGETAFSNDWQITEAFNIASGLADFFTPYGHPGVAFFGFLCAGLAFILRAQATILALLSLTVLYACLMLMVFNNNLMSLNVAFQFVILWVAFRPVRKDQSHEPTAMLAHD